MKIHCTSQTFTEVSTQKKRKGMTLVELLGVMIVIAILSVIAIGGISAARDNANQTSVISDMRTFENSVKQMLMMHPEVMKFVATKPAGASDLIIKYLNEQMEEQWAFEPIGGGAAADGGAAIPTNTDSGAVATTVIKRDAWGNAYCLYIYFDNLTTTYAGSDGMTPLANSDSQVYMVIASPGKNSTGVGLGADGNNYDATSKKLVNPDLCVNNTDGIDDMGLIVRVLNGSVYSATFGTEKAILGKLDGIQWVFGLPAEKGGVVHDYENQDTTSTKTVGTVTLPEVGAKGGEILWGGSLDQFYDYNAIQAQGKVTWIGGPSAVTKTA